MAPGVSRRWGLSWVESNLSTPQPDVNETLLFYFFSLLTLSLAVSSTAAHGWNESFMPVVHRPTHILTLPGSHAASVSIQATASMHIYIYWKKQCLDVAYYTSAPPPLGFCQPVVYFLLSPLRLSVSVCVCVCLSVCQSALLRLALGGQPFSISNDVPRKSVSRATGVPNTLPAASRWCVLCLHFSYLCEDVGCTKQARMGTQKKKKKKKKKGTVRT